MATLPKDQIQTLINVLHEAKARARKDLLEYGYVRHESTVAYQVAVMALTGDRVVESIECLLNEAA